MNIKNWIFQICLHYLLISTSDGWRPFTSEFTNVSSYSSVDYIKTNSSISSSGFISLFFNVSQTIPNLYTKVLITVDTLTGIYDLELINKTIDSCEFFKNSKYEPIIQFFYRLLTNNGYFPTSCPIRKKLYFVKDVRMDSENLPRIMPYKGCIADITMMQKTGNNFKILSGYNIHMRVK